jgi:hypothetical protein
MTAPATPAPAAPAASPAPAVVPPAAVDPVTPVVVAPKPAATPLAPAVEPKAGDPPPPPVVGSWPDDWRTRASKNKDGTVDDKRLARLARYASPEVALDALINAQDRIAKGDLQKVLGANPTADEVAEYRLANGIPVKPEEYKVELPGGRVVGEADKPLVGKFLESMHKVHAPPALVNSALTAYYEMQDEQIRAREDADVDAKVLTEDLLKDEYGQEYRPNLKAVKGLLDQFGDEAGNRILSARFPDGSLMFNDPAVMRAFVHLARELNPAATVAPGSTASAGQTMADEINALKADMANEASDYYTAPKISKTVAGMAMKDTPKAIRYRELLAAQERLQAKAA